MNEENIVKPNNNGLATAALILGIVAALGFVFVFPPFIFGATAIVLGLLSKTGDSMSMRAKIGICMGTLSILLLCLILISAVHIIMTNPGMLDEFRNNFDEIYNGLLTQEGGYI
ncbi:MAG: hypothetical protein K5668_09060 [Lachnospiraceae bacterium]|nr:hypothetical protein [Lachnospiraceae bacterium]